MMKIETEFKELNENYSEEYEDELINDESELLLFKGHDKPNPRITWDFYQEALSFNASIRLEDNVKLNENFYIGKQWEGVDVNGLPTPVFNFLKRVVGFITASITSDSVRATATTYSNVANKAQLKEITKAVNDEFQAITDRNRITFRIREMVRQAAIDGDAYLYSYWDSEEFTGMKIGNVEVKGAIKTELIENTRIFFGNPSDSDIQSQPYIIIAKRQPLRNVKLEAKANGLNWKNITSDEDDSNKVDESKHTDGLVTVLFIFWKDDETDEVWCYECTRGCTVREPWSLGIKLYPITGMSWDKVPDCYHGQAMITGLIPNQVFINKTYAMTMLNIMRSGFGKVIYDKTRVAKWDNRVGGAIPINGGDVNTVARILDPPPINPQITQFIGMSLEETEKSLGATAVALGDTRPDNTSAIISLQRAAATPSENTKQNIYDCTEDLYDIYLEFMGVNYGKRYIDMPTPSRVKDAADFALMGGEVSPDMIETPEEIPVEFDFSILKNYKLFVKVDVGASAYYSEIAARSTLDNLLMNGQIDIVDYLERIPNDYIPEKEALLAKKKKQLQQQQAMAAQPPMPTGGVQGQGPMEIAGGTGYGGLQRAINKAGDTKGIL